MRLKDSLRIRALVLSGLLVVSFVVVLFSNVPRAVADSRLFEDGFESEDFSAWTGTYGDAATIVESPVHHGDDAAMFGRWLAYATKTLGSSYTTLYARMYFQLHVLPSAEGGMVEVLTVLGGSTPAVFIRVVYVSGNLVLRMISPAPSYLNVDYAYAFQIDTWYCLEIKCVKASGTSGEYRVYLNGVDVCDRTGVDTSGLPDLDTVEVGMVNSALWNDYVYVDCCVMDSSYIEPENTYSLTVTVTPVGSGSVAKSPDQSFYNWGTNVTLTATAATGYGFDHWTLNGSNAGSVNPYTLNMTANYDLTAVFAPIEYSLVVSTVGSGSVNRNDTGPYYYGDKVELTAVPATGWVFSDWSGDLVGSVNPAVITMDGSKNVVATFSQSEYTLAVTVSPVGGGSVILNNTGPYHYGDWVRLTAVANLGWSFSQWSGDASGTSSQVDVFIDGDKSITADFIWTGYVLTVSVSGHGSTNATGAHVYDMFINVSVLASPASGSFFDHWLLDSVDVGSMNPYTLNMTADFDLTAVFLAYQRTLTVTVDGYGSTNATGAFSYDLYSNVTVLATPDLGYRLDYWILNSNIVGSLNPYTLNMTDNFDLTAVFARIQYSLTVSVSGEGSTNATGTFTHDAFSNVTVLATPASGWVFDHWTLDSTDAGSANPYTINMTNNFDLTAVFTQLQNSYLAVRGADNLIYYRLYNATSGSWQDWNVVPYGSTPDSPAAALYSGKLYFVVRSMDGYSLYFSWVNLTDSSFSGWTWLNGLTESAPTLVQYGPSLVLVVRGLDNTIYYRFYNCVSDIWGDWMQVPSGFTIDSPAATVLGHGLHFVVRSADGYSIWHSFINMSNSEFSGWQRVDGFTGSRPVLAASESRGELYLVVRGLDDRIYYKVWNAVVWTDWTALPSGSTCDGAGAIVINNKLNVVVRGSEGTSLWLGQVDLSTSDFSGWTWIDGLTNSAPTVTS